MDANVTLQLLRDALRDARRYQDNETGAAMFCEVPNHVIDEINNRFDDLDGWLSSGGFAPDDWRSNET